MKDKNQPKKDPVPKTIKQAEAVVQRRFAAVLESATLDKRRTLCEFERELWVQLLALGRALVALFFVKAAQRPRAATYEHDGEPCVLADKRTTEVGTRFGKVPFRRRVGRRVGAPRRVCDRPIDRELGLGGGFSAYFAQSDRPDRAIVDSQIAHCDQWRGVDGFSSCSCGVSLP
ncbi:MAG: hypothetical protein RIF41_38495 [Polyangiaceae bacterium]